jgi:regulatory protein
MPRANPKPLTQKSLENAALFYLERYASSAANLRRVLMRRVTKSAEEDKSVGKRMVEELVARYLVSGLIDDRTYATQRAASLHRRGTSKAGIRGKLAQKGVEAQEIAAALDTLGEAGGELAAVAALIRRRRLGPYRAPGLRAEHRQRDLAVLARAGFGLALARRALAAADPDALARMLEEAAGE